MTSLHHTKRSNAGFTLIEIMITVAVIAILAAVALPQYFDYVTRSRLVEAKTNLADMRTRLEQYFLDNRAYPTACVTGATAPPNISLPASQKFFNVTCAFGLAPPTYTITATDTFSKAPPRFVFTVNEANLRQTPTVAAGWTSSTVCWISKKSGDC